MEIGQRFRLAAAEIKVGHFREAGRVLLGRHQGRQVQKHPVEQSSQRGFRHLVGKIYRKLTGRQTTVQPVSGQGYIRQMSAKLAAEALNKKLSPARTEGTHAQPVRQEPTDLKQKKKALPGYHQQPERLKRDLKRLDAKSPHAIEAFSLKIQKAIAELKADNPGDDLAAQDWMFSLFKQVSFGKRDLALIAKLRQIDVAGYSNPHLNSLRMFLNMAVAIDLVKKGPRPLDHNDVARMDKSGNLDEKKQAIALRARTSWMAQASPSELRRLSLQPAKINQIVGCAYDMRAELATLQDAIAAVPESVAENRQLRIIHSKIETLMTDLVKRRDDFAVNAVLHDCKKQLAKLANSSSADMAAVNFARVWDQWPENYVKTA
ncbi:hypothetical protein ACWJJH_15590 [Endozoicomonadaceae bacterium StTr2]